VNARAAKLVDLSVPLGPSPSEHVPVVIDYMSHAFGGAHLAELTGVAQGDLTGGLGWASERVTAITHSGTHVDAPFHYAPQCSGAASRTIDALPLEWFFGDGVCVDVRGGSGAITIDELQQFERAQERPIEEGDIVLFLTGAASAYGSAEYGDRGRSIAPELVLTLCERGVHVIGTDAWSIDPPLTHMRNRAAAEGAHTVWQAHYTGRQREFCAVEKLTNLETLPPSGFTVVCFPVKVAQGSAGWTRAVAIVPPGGEA
jgi:kynurenine formamidase